MIETMEGEKQQLQRKYRMAEAKLKHTRDSRRIRLLGEDIDNLKRREQRFNGDVAYVNEEVERFHNSPAFKASPPCISVAAGQIKYCNPVLHFCPWQGSSLAAVLPTCRNRLGVFDIFVVWLPGLLCRWRGRMSLIILWSRTGPGSARKIWKRMWSISTRF